MEIKTKFDYCGNCKTYCEHNFGVENFDLNILNLENYKNYKDLYVYKCPKCGLISTDISNQDDGKVFDELKNDSEFLSALNYSYLFNFDLELLEPHTKSVPANQYEVYSMMQKKLGNNELFLRALYKSIELKELIIKKYEISVAEEDDEEDIEALGNLTTLMQRNIFLNRRLFLTKFLELENKNNFLNLMFIENLICLGEQKEAKLELDLFLSDNNINVDDDLKLYFNDLLKEKK